MNLIKAKKSINVIFIVCSAVYILLSTMDFIISYSGATLFIATKQRKMFLLSYSGIVIEYITPWIFLLSCICFAIRKRWGYWIFGIGTIMSAVSISIWNKVFQEPWRLMYSFSTELSSQKYTILYIQWQCF